MAKRPLIERMEPGEAEAESALQAGNVGTEEPSDRDLGDCLEELQEFADDVFDTAADLNKEGDAEAAKPWSFLADRLHDLIEEFNKEFGE